MNSKSRPLSADMRRRIALAVEALHARGEFPSQRLVLKYLGRSVRGQLTKAENLERRERMLSLGLTPIDPPRAQYA